MKRPTRTACSTDTTFTPAEQQRLTKRVISVAANGNSYGGGSIGAIERLAGIEGEAARRDLWFAHRDQFNAPTQVLFDAVMDDCRRRIVANGIDWVAL